MTQLRILELAQATVFRNINELQNRQSKVIEKFRHENLELKARINLHWEDYFEIERMITALKEEENAE